MKNFIVTTALILSLSFSLSFNANASLLNIDVQANEVNVGDSLTVVINAKDFDATDLFWVDFGFDTSVFSFDIASLTSDLNMFDGIDPFSGLENKLTATGITFDFLTDFALPVGGDFVLASFNLIATAVGFSDFSADGSDYVFDYTMNHIGSASTQVNAGSTVSVPEPSTALMMLVAGFALVRARRQG